MRSHLILLMCLLFLIYYFVDFTWLGNVVIVVSILAFLASAANASRFPKVVSILMMSTGIILEINKGSGLDGVSHGILLILPLLCLVTLAPLLSIPLKLGGYFESVDSLLRNLLHYPKRMFAGITMILFILSPILSLGSVRMISEFLKDLKLPSAMSAKGYLIGFSTAIMWSPYFASVSLVLYYLDIQVGSYILYGIGLSVLSLLVGNVLFAFWERNHPLDQSVTLQEEGLDKHHRIKLLQLAMFVLILLAVSLTIEYLTKWSMIIIVCLISMILPLLWGLVTNGWKRLIPLLRTYRDESVLMLNNEIALFMSAGLLAHAIQGTRVANQVSQWLTDIANVSFLLFALSVMCIVLVVTYVGVHQIAVIAALAMQLNYEELGMTSLSLAMLLLLAWSVSSSLSPLSGLNLMVSRIVGISGIDTGARANGLHLSLLTVMGIGIFLLIS